MPDYRRRVGRMSGTPAYSMKRSRHISQADHQVREGPTEPLMEVDVLEVEKVVLVEPTDRLHRIDREREHSAGRPAITNRPDAFAVIERVAVAGAPISPAAEWPWL